MRGHSLVDWAAVPGLSNETVADMFEVPKGLTAWDAAPILSKYSNKELEAQALSISLHHAQFERWALVALLVSCLLFISLV